MSGYKNLFYAWYRAVRNWAMSILCMSVILFPSLVQAFTATSLGDYGNVSIMQVSGNFDALNPDATVNSVPRQVITREFFKTHKDEYDFVVIFSKFDYKMPEGDASAFYSGIKNDVSGIGQEIFDYSSEYGSNGKLQGTIDMGNLVGKTSDPTDPNFDLTLSTLAHEMLHRWGAWVKFKEADGTLSRKLLGKDGSHWSYLLDSKGSVAYGNQWRDNGDGTFTSLIGKRYFSPLDLYLMGVLDKSQVPPMLLIDNPDIDPDMMPGTSVTISGTARQIGIDDIVAAEGERLPAAKDAQKQFKMAFVFVTDDGNFSGDQLSGIESIRNGFLTRFSILTDGKALVQVASTPKDDLATNPGVRPVSTVPRTLPPSVNEGISWLMSHQQADGSWVDFSLTTARDTAEVATTLQRFPVAQQQLQGGLQWLANNASANIDYLARRIETVAATGGDASLLLQDLVGRRNLDGGWGSARDFESNPTDTALALKAVAKAGYGDQSVIAKAVAYLQRVQNSDGGWSGGDSISTIQPTAAVLSVFNLYRKSYNLDGNISQAIAFLSGKQNTDGGFGNSPSTVYDSAVAVMALQESGADKEMLGRGAAYLDGLQGEDGSWQESPYQTALAVRAVWQATVDPDLSISADDITFIPEKVTTLPTNAVVNAVIRNLGRSDVPQVKVALYQDVVAADKKIGEQVVAVPGMSPVTVTFSVPVTDGAGHSFHFVIDPDNLVKEPNKNNNSAQKPLLPEVSYDFTVSPDEVTLSVNPVDVQQDVKVGFSVQNHGTSNAYNVPVRVFVAESGGALEVASVTMDIPAGGKAIREVLWKPTKHGLAMPLTIQVDPLNVFDEISEQNNQASVPVTVNSSNLPNLAVSYKDIIFSENPAKEGRSVNVSVSVNNDGFSDAGNVVIKFYNGVPEKGGILLGSQLLPVVAAGTKVDAIFEWAGIAMSGVKTISVVVDPDDAVSETRQDDNSAFSTLNILSLPDLLVATNSVVLNPAAPKEGDAVTASISVQNAGEQDARDVLVRVTEAGTELGTAVIPLVKANSLATATITVANVQRGTHQLAVAVDPENRVQEGSELNNTAVKGFMAQNGELWLSERYFSPNGDGVKDTTQLSFVVETLTSVKVAVENRGGELVRTFSGGELDDTTAAVVTWDGKNDDGLLMPDGLYSLKVYDKGGVLLGDASVLLDNNRSTLMDAISSNSLSYNKLLSNLSSIGSWTWLADDSGIVVQVLYHHPDFSPGLYFVSPEGQDAHRLISGEGVSIVSYDVSPATGKVAAVLSKSSQQATSTEWTVQDMVVETDIEGAVLKQVASYETKYSLQNSGSTLIDQNQYTVLGPIKWSNKGNSLMYSTSTYVLRDWNYIENGISQIFKKETFETWVTQSGSSAKVDTIINPGEYFKVDKISWSPDDQRLAMSTSDVNCRVIDMAGGAAKTFQYGYYYVTGLFWFNNTSFFVIAQNGAGYPWYPTRRGFYLADVVKDTIVKIGEQKTLHWQKFTGPFISPDRTRFAYTTQDNWLRSTLKIQTADGTTTTVYTLQMTSPPKDWNEAPYLDTVTWSPDGKQLTFIEWDVTSYNKIYYGPKFVVLNPDDQTFTKYDYSSSHLLNKDRFIDWMNDGQYLLGSYGQPTFGYFMYYLFNSKSGEIYEWLKTPQLSEFLQTSPLEHYIAYKTYSTNPDLMSASSYLNLVSELRVIRSNSALVLKGTAHDASFDGYRIEYSEATTPSEWTLISPPSDVPMVSGTFATWVPPHPGAFLVRLTVWDKAGNTRSSTKTVMWNVNSTVATNFMKTYDFFSPNGDGTRDQVELSYTVLQPVHLEFAIYDQSGNIVRTFQKHYTEKTNDTVTWDGLDDSGFLVPDGKYTIKVLTFEFPVEVDNKVPLVSAGISPIAVDQEKNLYYVNFDALAYDQNIKSWKIEYGEGDNPTQWQEYLSGSENLAAVDASKVIISPVQQTRVQKFNNKATENAILWLKGKTFRVTAEDFAGNRSAFVANRMDEKVVISHWDNLFVPNQSILPNYADHVSGFETTSRGSTTIVIQYWDGLQWHDATGSDSINGVFSASWNGASASSAVYGVRAKAIDSLGGAFYSPTVQIENMFNVYQQCSDGAIKGVNALPDSVVLLKLQVLSSDDPRFTSWTDYQVFDSTKGDSVPKGTFTLPLPATRPGLNYQIRMTGIDASGKTSTTQGVRYPDKTCGDSGVVWEFPLRVSYDEAKGCGNLSPGIVTLDAAFPGNVTGEVAFLSLNYHIRKPEGWQLLRKIDLRSEGWGNFRFSTSDLPEGEYPVKVTLTYLDKSDFNKVKEVSSSSVVRVDRVLPAAHITYPAGQANKVCPVKVNGPGGEWFGIPVEASISDNLTVKRYELYYGSGSNPDQWSSAAAPAWNGSQVVQQQISGSSQKSGAIGLWNVTGMNGGRYTLRIRATDGNGNISCGVGGVSFDNVVGVPFATVDKTLLSPNHDGVNDDVRLSYQIDQDSSVDIKVYKLMDDGRLETVPVRTLFSGMQVAAGTQSANWDGNSDAGTPVPDGRYALVITAKDTCGNSATKSATVEVDRTPPAAVIVFPKTGDVPGAGNLVEVRGTVTDGNFQGFTVEEGEGTAPVSWITVGSGKTVVQDGLLATWNTFGHQGVWTLRLSATDRAGNKNSAFSSIDLGERKSLIRNAELSPTSLSPNDDGRQDSTTVAFEVTEAAKVGIEVVDASGAAVASNSVIATVAGSFQYVWDGKGVSGAKVPDGAYKVKLVAASSANPSITQTEILTAVVDATKPAIEVKQPTNDACLNKAAVAVSGSITDNTLTGYVLNITGPSGGITEETGTQNRVDYTFATLSDAPEGGYAVSVEAKDAGGNEHKAISKFSIDRTPPKVVLLSPVNGSVFGGEKPVMELAGSIAEKNLEKFSIRYGVGDNPTEWKELVGSGVVPVTSQLFLWKLGKDDGVADGAYTVSIYAKDKAGQEGEARIRTVIDNASPKVEIASLKDGDYVRAPVSVYGSAEDATFDRAFLQLSEGRCDIAYKWGTIGNLTQPVKEGVLENWTALPVDGEYCLKLSAQDKVGNKAERKVSIKVDTHPPAASTVTATVENRTGARLDWTRNSEPDAVGYNVYRNGQKINNALLTDITFSDSGLKEGSYAYTVKTVDTAGNESAASTAATVKMDVSVPDARITMPYDNDRVGGLVDIKGSAFSLSDFKEYRVSVGAGSNPQTWQIIRKSPMSISSGSLAQWDTTLTGEGAYAVKLEAEDLTGNVATYTISLTVDNTAPSRPLNLSLEASCQDVTVNWGGGPDTDVAGYLLYRNDQLVNATSVAVSNLKFYAINATAYVDKLVPDGRYTYYVVAMDQAGNLSLPSESKVLVIDTRPPHATIAEPADGARFEGRMVLRAEVADSDVASIKLQYRKTGEVSWNDSGAPVTGSPYLLSFNAAGLGLPYGQYELRVVATDNGGKIDPAPSSITVTHTDVTAPSAPTGLGAAVNGSDAILSWSGSPETDVDGFNIYRTSGANRTKVNMLPVKGFGYQELLVTDGVYSYEVTAVDTFGNEGPSASRTVKIYAPLLVQPSSPVPHQVVQVTGSNAAPNASVELFNQTGQGEVSAAIVVADAQGNFVADGISLSVGENRITAVATDGSGNISRKAAAVSVTYVEPPAAPSELAVSVEGYDALLSWAPNPAGQNVVAYYVYRDGERVTGPFNLTAGEASASSILGDAYGPSLAFDAKASTGWSSAYSSGTFTPAWWQLTLPAAELITHVDVDWTSGVAGKDFELQGWNGTGWTTLATMSNNTSLYNSLEIAAPIRTDKIRVYISQTTSALYVKRVGINEVRIRKEIPVTEPLWQDSRLKDKIYRYQVAAVNAIGFEGALSDEVTAIVGDVTPPSAAQGLVATAAGSDVTLGWTYHSDPDAVGFNVYRADALGWVKTNGSITVSGSGYVDPSVPNGTYRYRVSALDAAGNESEPSNEVEVFVSVPLQAAPLNVIVVAVSEGSSLEVQWTLPGTAAAAFNVYRSTIAGGPYSKVNPVPVTPATYLDATVTIGTRYFYVVTTLDAAGNEGEFSEEASGVPADTSAPAPPVIFSPTLSDTPVRLYKSVVDIVGNAEPGASVDLFRDNVYAATTTALQMDVDSQINVPYSGNPYALSPDGTRFTYYDYSTYTLSIKDTATNAVTRIAMGGSSPKWSPDGTKVAYVYSSGTTRIGIFDLKTNTSTPLTTDVNVSENQPSWAADGTKIIFISNKNGSQDVWMKELETGVMSQLTNGANASNPLLSPDGTAYLYLQGTILSVANTASGASVVIDDKTSPANCTWSPDGKQIAFVSATKGHDDLYLYDVQNGALSQLTDSLEPDALPAWSRDSRHIGYVRRETNSYTLLMHSLDAESRVLKKNLLTSYSVVWADSGVLFCLNMTYVTSVRPKGLYTFGSVVLEPGENLFKTIATDDTGNQSQPSQPVSVTLDSSRLPDVSVSAEDIFVYPAFPKPGERVTVSAVVKNLRETAAENVDLGLYLWDTNGNLQLLKTIDVLNFAAGAEYSINSELPAGLPAGMNSIIAIVDASNTVMEGDKNNNHATREFYVTDKEELLINATLDAAEYGSNQEATIAVIMRNSGTAMDGVLNVAIEDESGARIAGFDSVATTVEYGTESHPFTWNTRGTFPGAYRLHSEFTKGDGTIIEAVVPLVILPDIRITSESVPDRRDYGATEDVGLSVSIKNGGGNTIIENLRTKVRIIDSENTEVSSEEKIVRYLFAGDGSSLLFKWNTGLHRPGQYRAELETYLDGRAVSASSSSFTIRPAWSLSGTLSIDAASVIQRQDIKGVFTVANKGNTETGTTVIQAVIIDPATLAIVTSAQRTINLSVNGSQTLDFAFLSGALELKSYQVLLQYVVQGNVKNIASSTFTVIDGKAPVVSVDSPLKNAIYNTIVPFSVFVTDDASGVERVEYQLDGGEWKALVLADPALGKYVTSWEPGATEAPDHTVSFRAVDRSGNQSAPVSVNFQVQMDSAAPVTTINLDGARYEAASKLYVSPGTLFTLTASDDFSGVAKTEYRIGSGAWTPYAPFTLTTAGESTVYYRSVDRAGNQEQEKSLLVWLDKDVPTTVLTASDSLAAEGVTTVSPVTVFTLAATDSDSGINRIWYRIDEGQWLPFGEGFTLSGLAAGKHDIRFQSIDNVGNEEEKHSLTVRLIRTELVKEISPESAVLVGAWTDNLNRVKNEAAIDAVRSILSSRGVEYRVAKDGEEFKSALRSGKYSSYLLLDYRDEKVGGELREAVNYGDSLIYIKTKPGADPSLEDVFGMKLTGETTSDGIPVNLSESPLTAPLSLLSGAKCVVGSVVADTATVFGFAADKRGQVPAVVYNEYGAGKVVLFTFDLLNSKDAGAAAGLLGDAVTLVKPERHKVHALGAVPIDIAAVNSTEPVRLRFKEILPSATVADDTPPEGATTEEGFIWEQELESSQTAKFRYYLRLPDVKGEYKAVTEVYYANEEDYRLYAVTELTLEVSSDSSDLLAGAISDLGAVTATADENVLLADAKSKLSQVDLNPLTGKDAEKEIESLTRIIDLIGGAAGTADARIKLDELLKTMERKWYLLKTAGNEGAGSL